MEEALPPEPQVSSKFSMSKMNAPQHPKICISKKKRPPPEGPRPTLEFSFGLEWNFQFTIANPHINAVGGILTWDGGTTWSAMGIADDGGSWMINLSIPTTAGTITGHVSVAYPDGTAEQDASFVTYNAMPGWFETIIGFLGGHFTLLAQLA